MTKWNAIVLTSVFLMLSMSCPGRSAITIDGYKAAKNDRFTNSPDFIGAKFDWSGVGRANSGQWVTLISRNVVVSAFHSSPGTNLVVNFYPSNDPSSAPIQRTVTSTNQKIGATDLWVGVLNENVPESIKQYNFVNTFLEPGMTPSAGAFSDVNAYMVGISPEIFSGLGESQAIGRNLVSEYVENVGFEGNADNDSLTLNFDPATVSKHVEFEARLASRDSGAPLFIEFTNPDTQKADLLLLGINAFVGDLNGVDLSGVNYIGNQATAINQFISINAVPEPSSSLLILTTMMGGGLLARRKSKVTAHKQSA
jgi:hypothetical protein